MIIYDQIQIMKYFFIQTDENPITTLFTRKLKRNKLILKIMIQNHFSSCDMAMGATVAFYIWFILIDSVDKNFIVSFYNNLLTYLIL